LKIKTLLLPAIALTFFNCNNDADPYIISKHNVGLLTDSTQVSELKYIYETDSIAKHIGGDEFTGDVNDIEIFENGGIHLLTLTPFEALDSTSYIKSVKINDDRYHSEKGLTNQSTFKDIHSNYKISRIQNTINNIVVSVDEINAYFTIDKKDLPAELRYDMNLKIEAIQIPDNAKIKSFYIHWF